MKTILQKIQREEHGRCFMCGRDNERGFKLDFNATADGGLEAFLGPSDELAGYSNVMHGGVMSALFDSVMTNCLFARGIKALTAELKTRFLVPVQTNAAVQLRACIERCYGNYYILKATLFQEGILKAKATGKFVAFSKQTARANKPGREKGLKGP
ncbi:MAG: PaaI family thioesterase [Candidatus Omnitrophica bacterium]|nr:PaaI family thioesterase [Candidatus Omnitrophota bacterium]